MLTVWIFEIVFEFNVADMEGIYTNRHVVILATKKLNPWFKQRGFKVLIRDELYVGRKLNSEIFKTSNIIVQCCAWSAALPDSHDFTVNVP